MGLTVGCARCHDHKYDPILQKEYYQLFAFFNNCDEPNLSMPTPEQSKQLEQQRLRAASMQKQLQGLDNTTPARQKAWEAALTQPTRAMLPAALLIVIER